MYGRESWTIRKAECQRIDAFKLWCWRRLLRVPWTARKPNQSTLKEINPEYLLEGLMLKLKLQYFGHLMWRTDSLENTLTLGKIEGRRRNGWQRMIWLNGIMDSMDLSLNKLQETMKDGNLACCSPWGHKESDTTWWLSNSNRDRRNKTIKVLLGRWTLKGRGSGVNFYLLLTFNCSKNVHILLLWCHQPKLREKETKQVCVRRGWIKISA